MAGVLAKSTRRDPADLPAEPERLLDSPTYEGFPIRPLYTALDALPEPALPGQWPFVRGGDALRDVKSGWRVAEAVPRRTDRAAEANGAVLVALTEGVSALVLRVGDGWRRPAELDRLLEGVFLDLVPVVLDAGADYAAASDAVLALLTDLDDDQRVAAVGGSGRRPADRAAERATGAERGRRRRGGRQGRPDTTVACGRSPSTAPPFMIWAPARRGSWRAASPPGVGYLRVLGEGGIGASRMRCGRSASASPPTTTSS